MAINYPGPYEVRVNYSVPVGGTTLIHQHRFSLEMSVVADPGADFSEFTPLGRQGAYADDLEVYVGDYLAEVQAFYPTTADFNDAELWEYEPGSFNAAFRSVLTLGLNGTHGSPGAQDAQAIISFRGTLGGPLKMDFRNSIYPQGIFQTFPTSESEVNSYAGFVTTVNTPIRARDGGFAFSPLKFLPGVNEAMTKKRLR